jgi:hypothetical protein
MAPAGPGPAGPSRFTGAARAGSPHAAGSLARVAVWDELKPVLARLRDQQPGTLMLSPMPEVDQGRQPPFMIQPAPWAVAAAENLHRQFGDDVDLTVGALALPARPLSATSARHRPARGLARPA